MAKPKNLVDAFLFQNAKKAVDLLSNDKEAKDEKGSISEQDRSSIISISEHEEFAKETVSISLAKSQTAVYLWFLDRGDTGFFNKPEIQHSLSMPYITVRKAINKLETLGILELSYDGCQKIYEYKINKDKRLKLAKNISIIS